MLTCAVDVGSTFIKASLRRGVDDVLARSALPFPRRTNDFGSLHADVRRAVLATVREVCDRGGSPDVIAMSCQMSGLSILAADDQPVGPLVPGVKQRSPRGGVPLDLRASGCADPAISSLAKFLWCEEEFPGIRARAQRIGGVKEYLLHALTGRWATDRASASASGFYDITGKGWSAATLRETNLSEEMLPELVKMEAVVGGLQPAAAAACGVPAETPVLCGLGDGPAANISVGAVGDGVMCFSHGTTLVARVLFSGKVPEVGLPLFVQHVSGSWKCVGVRFTEDRQSGSFVPTGRSAQRVPQAAIYRWLQPLLEAFAIWQVRPIGGRPVDLPASWPIRTPASQADDGTRAMALLANGISLANQASDAHAARKGTV